MGDVGGPSLEQIENDRWGEPPADATRLVSTVHALRRRPLHQLTPEDLRLLIGQQVGLPVLIPIAMRRLRADPLISGDYYPGDLLNAVLRIETAFWGGHPELRRDLHAILDHAAEQLPPELEPAARAFRTM